MNPSGFYVDPVYDVLAAIKKIKTFLKKFLLFFKKVVFFFEKFLILSLIHI